jgi:DNA-binding response OmpR family regulator
MIRMGTNSTLLCIHHDPAQLSLLTEHGYELVSATSGHDGLRLFRSRPVDAVVIEYHPGLLDGSAVAAEIKKVKPQVPVVMLTDHLELPDRGLTSIDALVTKSDGPHFLLATVYFLLNVKPTESNKGKLGFQTPTSLRHRSRSRQGSEKRRVNPNPLATDEQEAPFSRSVWRIIRNGTVQF